MDNLEARRNELLPLIVEKKKGIQIAVKRMEALRTYQDKFSALKQPVSQREYGILAGIEKGHYCKIATGVINLSIDQLLIASVIYNVSVHYLLGVEDYPIEYGNRTKDCEEQLYKLKDNSESQLKMLNETIMSQKQTIESQKQTIEALRELLDSRK